MSYDCPYCGADDSTRCDKLKPVECYPGMKYPKAKLQAARDVGCRVVHYIDKEPDDASD